MQQRLDFWAERDDRSGFLKVGDGQIRCQGRADVIRPYRVDRVAISSTRPSGRGSGRPGRENIIRKTTATRMTAGRHHFPRAGQVRQRWLVRRLVSAALVKVESEEAVYANPPRGTQPVQFSQFCLCMMTSRHIPAYRRTTRQNPHMNMYLHNQSRS